jgi:hypothetical protein
LTEVRTPAPRKPAKGKENRPGPVLDTINEFAAEFANAHPQTDPDRTHRDALEGVRKALSNPQLF